MLTLSRLEREGILSKVDDGYGIGHTQRTVILLCRLVPVDIVALVLDG